MKVLPAIDLLDGQAVRLRKGRREDVTVYSDDPPALAHAYRTAGASMLHVVDLTGAFAAGPRETAIISAMAADGPVQAGGGVRRLADIEKLMEAGAARVVIGTKAVTDAAFLEAACARFPGAITVAVDAHGDKVAISGWTASSDATPLDVAKRAVEVGAAAILYTDIDRDGMSVGPNYDRTAALKSALGDVTVIASGGVGTLAHLESLATTGADEVVVGKALLDGAISFADAAKVAG